MARSLVELRTLAVGSLFWYWRRGWKVVGHDEDGRVRYLCIDDGGEGRLPGDLMVEPL